MKTTGLVRAASLVGLLLAVAGCSGGPTPAGDAGVDTTVATDVVGADHAGGDGAAVCTTDAQCDDGTYCDGAEHCAPGTAGADARGCVHGAAPCTAMQMCTEATRACGPMVCTHMSTPDMDGDGHADIACGGDDCDDTDPHRFPGNPEVCLVGSASDGDGGTTLSRTGMLMGAVLDPTHDEDCDPTTFASATTGDGDHDMDGYVDSACSNVDRSGMHNHGSDCRDLVPATGFAGTSQANTVQPGEIRPMQTETCNGIDDNCNDMVDEGVQTLFYQDCDGDLHGAATDTGTRACFASLLTACMGHQPVVPHDDCNDARSDIHPGAAEVCDTVAGAAGAVDENCDGTANVGCVCVVPSMRACGSTMGGCAAGSQPCTMLVGTPGSTWGTCLISATPGACYADPDGDLYAVVGAAMTMACTCPGGTTARQPVASDRSTFDCSESPIMGVPGIQIHPGATEACNGVDDNCDGAVDDGSGFACTGGPSPQTRACASCRYAGTQSCGSTTCAWPATCDGVATMFGPWNGNGTGIYHGCGGGYSCGPGGSHWCWSWTAAAPLSPGCTIMGGPYVSLPVSGGYSANAVVYASGNMDLQIQALLDTSPVHTILPGSAQNYMGVTAPVILSTGNFAVTTCDFFEINVNLIAAHGGGTLELVGSSATRTSGPATAN